jgi:hypothetical protein
MRTIEQFKELLKKDIIIAMKGGNKIALVTLRSISSAITNAEIANRDVVLNYIDILLTLSKQRKQSIDAYVLGGNDTLADNERMELVIIEEYLPKGMTDDELETALNNIINNLGGTITQKDMGKVIVMFKLEYPGQDMGKLSLMIKSKF